MPRSYVHKHAVIGGPNEEYRYYLERQICIADPLRTVGFIGYNPSTADGTVDDHTIRKEVEFARRWGYHRMIKANIYAYRATDWRKLFAVEDPFGPENPQWLAYIFQEAEIVVCAWGAMPFATDYAKSLTTWAMGRPTARCLGKTKRGAPRHPLMLAYSTPLEEIC